MEYLKLSDLPLIHVYARQLRSALAKHPKAIQWSEDGKSFYVPNRQRFECDVLGDPALGFKTQSFKNWVCGGLCGFMIPEIVKLSIILVSLYT